MIRAFKVQYTFAVAVELSFPSLWSHFLAKVAELASEGTMLVTPRIWRKGAAVVLSVLEGYPASCLKIFLVPRLYPALFRARKISDFRGASGERGRAALVLSQRRGMDRDCGAAQADALSALQSGWHAESARLFARIRRRQLPAKNGSRSADLLQQSQCTSRVRADIQRLGRGQSPTAEPDNPRSVEIPQMRRRRQHRRSDPRRRRLPAK